MNVPVWKYHGCGNDFLLLRQEWAAGLELPSFIRAACDRHTGIGADGLILAGTDPLEMRYYNADGSPAPMCGNGIRCFSAFCLDQGLAFGDGFPVVTGDGVKEVRVLRRQPFLAQVDMGRPDDDPRAVGRPAGEPLWGHRLEALGRTVELYSFFMATVHTVWLVEDAMDDRLLPLAEAIHRHPFFPEKTNVNLVQVVDRNTLRMRTWERGAGLTLACGTGACAAARTARRLGLCGGRITVLLPRGELEITIDETERVQMAGPARLVMKGEFCYETA